MSKGTGGGTVLALEQLGTAPVETIARKELLRHDEDKKLESTMTIFDPFTVFYIEAIEDV